MNLTTILILLFVLVVIWGILNFVLRLTAKIFGCGCLGILILGVLLLGVKALGGL